MHAALPAFSRTRLAVYRLRPSSFRDRLVRTAGRKSAPHVLLLFSLARSRVADENLRQVHAPERRGDNRVVVPLRQDRLGPKLIV